MNEKQQIKQITNKNDIEKYNREEEQKVEAINLSRMLNILVKSLIIIYLKSTYVCIKEKGAISLTYSAFKSNSFHRAEQARVFAQSLRDEILIMLKELLNNQNLEYKKLQKDARKYEKDMQNYVQNLTQAKNKFIDNDKYKQEQQILNEIAKLSNEFSVDKKQKQMTRTKQLQKQTRQHEDSRLF